MTLVSNSGTYYEVKDITLSDEVYYDVDYSQLRDYQIEVANKLLGYTNGLVQLYTGYGKTYLIAWLCKYLPRPILITEPTYALCEEIATRLHDMGVDMNGIELINPVAYVSRKNRDDTWLSDIKTLLSDETSINNSMEYLLNLMNPKIRFAFNYTPDKANNYNLRYLHNYKLSDDVCKMIEYFGSTLVYARLNKDLHIVVDDLHLGSCRYKVEDYEAWKYKRAIDKCFKSRELIPYITSVIMDCDSPILFPYTDHKQIEWLFNDPELSKYRLCIWSSGKLRLNNGKEYTDKNKWEGMGPYKIIKYLVNNNLVDVIFCSSVAFKGVDLPKLSNLILMIGSNAGNIIQIVGRICRSDNPRIFLPRNLDENPLYEASFNKRLRWIKTLLRY